MKCTHHLRLCQLVKHESREVWPEQKQKGLSDRRQSLFPPRKGTRRGDRYTTVAFPCTKKARMRRSEEQTERPFLNREGDQSSFGETVTRP